MDVSLFDKEGRFLQTLSGPLETVIVPTAEAMDAQFVEGVYDTSYKLSADGPIKIADPD